MTLTALILAAGLGTRMGGVSKAQLMLEGVTVLERTVSAFDKAKNVSSIVITAKADELDTINSVISGMGLEKPYTVICGGSCRQQSAKLAFDTAKTLFKCDAVAVHDGARCLILPREIDLVIEGMKGYDGSVAATRVTDTLKLFENGLISQTVDREKLIAVQTPQVFFSPVYEKALKAADGELEKFTDDCGMCTLAGARINPVFTGKNNIKLTTPEDIEIARAILAKRNENDV